MVFTSLILQSKNAIGYIGYSKQSLLPNYPNHWRGLSDKTTLSQLQKLVKIENNGLRSLRKFENFEARRHLHKELFSFYLQGFNKPS